VHYLLFYDLVDDYVERRRTLRAAHLTHARPYVERGELVLGGALTEPVDTAVLLFRGDGPAVAERFAAADPYVQQGLVRGWRVRPWITVAGAQAATPLSPDDAST